MFGLSLQPRRVLSAITAEHSGKSYGCYRGRGAPAGTHQRTDVSLAAYEEAARTYSASNEAHQQGDSQIQPEVALHSLNCFRSMLENVAGEGDVFSQVSLNEIPLGHRPS